MLTWKVTLSNLDFSICNTSWNIRQNAIYGNGDTHEWKN